MFSNFDENETGTQNIFNKISYIMLSSCVNERSINTMKHNEHNETQSLDKKSDISYLANRNSLKLAQIICFKAILLSRKFQENRIVN